MNLIWFLKYFGYVKIALWYAKPANPAVLRSSLSVGSDGAKTVHNESALLVLYLGSPVGSSSYRV